MSPSLSELLKLPARERAELAMALWESLSEAERAGRARVDARGGRGAGSSTFSGLSPQSPGMKAVGS